MLYINEKYIGDLLSEAGNATAGQVRAILNKAGALKRLSLLETAILLAVKDDALLAEIFRAAALVKSAIYGRRVVLFAPLYISNRCRNCCLYCSFKADNPLVERKALNEEEIKEQVRWLLKRGHKRILMVAAESADEDGGISYYCKAVKAIYGAAAGRQTIRRVNVNCAPLETEEFRRLKSTGIGTYQLFQETYHDATYRHVHPKGPKSDADYRITAIDRAFEAGIDDVGIGVLYGLYDYRFETLALLSHVEHLEKAHGVGPHTISVPRVEPASGADFSHNLPYPVADEDFKKIVAVLRLSVPYTGIILSTRETSSMRDELFHLGVSQISAESRTSAGGYDSASEQSDSDTQFTICDQRTLDEVIGSLIQGGFIPSFCTACYRSSRTGETFMNLARPGAIKEKCSLNALITLKEYLDDFASEKVRTDGYLLIKKIAASLEQKDQDTLRCFFEEMDKGIRDRYI